ETEGNGKVQQAEQPRAITAASVPAPGRMAIRAAPSVRQMARKLGIDLARVRGSGPEGRILIGDLTTLVQRATSAKPQAAGERLDYGKPGTRIKLIGLRRKIA